jgi:D-3-phosphoglycerate dehydrogenase
MKAKSFEDMEKSRTYESVVRQATCAVKNLILAMNGEKPIAQINPEVPVKKN